MNMNEIFSAIVSLADGMSGSLTDIRRHLHSHPELGHAEYETSEYLRGLLGSGYGYDFQRVGETGFCADLKTDSSLPWLALRADMDALPIADQKNVEYKSIHPGLSHACGHDFHSTVVLGVALILQKLKYRLRGNIRFIFQHAEEPIPGGAIDFVREGLLDNIRAVFGLHADPSLQYGQIGLSPGWISAQSIHIKISVEGPGGHSARPNEAPDPIFTGLRILDGLYSGLYRNLNNIRPFVFTIGKISGGESYNSIARHFSAEGTLRVTDTDQGRVLLEIIGQRLHQTCALEGLTAGFDYTIGAKPVINDPALTEKAGAFLNSILQPEQLVEARRSMGGEDFSAFLDKAPGVFIRIGVGNGRSSAPVHTGMFDIDERAIVLSVKIFCWLLLKFSEEFASAI
jgi:amidohydrolase